MKNRTEQDSSGRGVIRAGLKYLRPKQNTLVHCLSLNAKIRTIYKL